MGTAHQPSPGQPPSLPRPFQHDLLAMQLQPQALGQHHFNPPPRNDKELSRDQLTHILSYFSSLIPLHFDNRPVTLVVHGGACMLLHPQLFKLAQELPAVADGTNTGGPGLGPGPPGTNLVLPSGRRTSTRDVDIVRRSFVGEWAKMGVRDAGERLQNCVMLTARQFGLGLDWMNSDADVALPMANECVFSLSFFYLLVCEKKKKKKSKRF